MRLAQHGRRLRTGVAVAESYVLLCPHCRDAVPVPGDGSHQWSARGSAVQVARCVCGADLNVPKVLRSDTQVKP